MGMVAFTDGNPPKRQEQTMSFDTYKGANTDMREVAELREQTRPGAYTIPSHQIALLWRRIAAKKSNPNKETN